MALKTETDTPEMGTRVLQAFIASTEASTYEEETIQVDFEHGQWWVTAKLTGAQWSVADAVGGDAIDGFSFERITQGDEDG